MKKNFILFAGIFLISCITHAQKKQQQDDLKKLLKAQAVKISDTSLMSKYEVSNKLYNLFLADLKKSDPDKFLLAQVDTEKWNGKENRNAAMAKYYSSHPAYNEFPVVNISYEGAVLFCKWLKEKYLASTKLKIKELRLPSAHEWEMAAKAGNVNAVYSWPGTQLFDPKGKPYGQYKGSSEVMTEPGKLNDSWEETAPINLFKPNTLGLYNMCGNVAEMVSEKGQTKGGAWNSSAENLKITGPDEFANFSEPSPFIGFRYIIILEPSSSK